MEKFTDMNLREEILGALNGMGFEKPTPIQAQAIPFLIDSERDLIGLAQTGTGKTAAFSIPILNKLDLNANHIQALVLSPTRELATQTAKAVESLASGMNIRVAAIYGGEGIQNQIRQLRSGVDIVVGTPGRIKDLINRRVLKLEQVGWTVLDEADEMLSMGFKDELDFILEKTPEDKQTLLFSATMPPDIQRIAKNYMFDPEQIEVASRNIANKDIDHKYYLVRAHDKYEAFKRFVDTHKDLYCIVFCRTRLGTADLAGKLVKNGYKAEGIHGDLSQGQRENIMRRFRAGEVDILCATDVAARGIDVDDLNYVINFDLPENPEIYVHRSGRTGRAGKKGICISIVHSRERGKLKQIERMIKRPVDLVSVPSATEVCRTKIDSLVDEVLETEIQEDDLNKVLPDLMERFKDMERDEIIKKFISMEFNILVDQYKGSPNVNLSERDARNSRDRGRGDDRGGRRGRGDRRDRGGDRRGGRSGGRDESGYKRFFANVGKNEGMNPNKLISYINKKMHGTRVKIGKIDIGPKFTFFGLEEEFAAEAARSLKYGQINGVSIEIEPAKNPKPDGGNRSSKKSTFYA